MCRTNWKMTVMLAVSLAVFGVGGISVARADAPAEPAQVATVPATTTLDEALPDGGDSGIVKTAILKAASDRNLALSGSSTLKNVADEKLIVKITNNMDSYEALESVAGLFNGLIVNDQEDLSTTNMTAVTKALLANRPAGTELEALGLSNDGITTVDLKTLLDTIGNAPSAATLKYLLLNRNPITDFSEWTAFKSGKNKDKVYGLNAAVLKNPDGERITEGITLSPQKVYTSVIDGEKVSVIKMPFTDFNEFKRQKSLEVSGLGNDAYATAGIRYFDGSAGFFDQDEPLNTTKTYNLGERVYEGINPAIQADITPYDWISSWFGWLDVPGPEETIQDLSNFNVIDPQKKFSKVFNRENQISFELFRSRDDLLRAKDIFEDEASQKLQFKYPASQEVKPEIPNLDELYIINIPAGAKQIKVRTFGSSPDVRAVYTQIYTIPIKQESTIPTDNSQSESSSEADSETPKSVKPNIIYATKKIGLYQKPDFSKANRVRWYNQQPRTRRPMFEVMGEAKSTHGTPRYLVKDIDPTSKTYGETGYITKRADYVGSTYYTKAPTKATVISPKGINAYRRASLTGKVKHYRQGQVLPVVGIKQHNLTTRFKLKDGTYVTANKILVHSGRLPMVKKVVAKTKINRYKDVNLKKRIKPFRKGTKVAVLGYDFSAKGTQRYRVAGGYITANPKLVKAIK